MPARGWIVVFRAEPHGPRGARCSGSMERRGTGQSTGGLRKAEEVFCKTTWHMQKNHSSQNAQGPWDWATPGTSGTLGTVPKEYSHCRLGNWASLRDHRQCPLLIAWCSLLPWTWQEQVRRRGKARKLELSTKLRDVTKNISSLKERPWLWEVRHHWPLAPS